jgi:hypothetical protein
MIIEYMILEKLQQIQKIITTILLINDKIFEQFCRF